LARIDTDIQSAIDLLSRSELVGIPTETVYGLAGNAYDAMAVAKIFEVKERPSFDPLIVHTSSIERVLDFVDEIPPIAYKLGGHFWPGPLTLVFNKKPIIPDLVTSGLSTVAVRIPNHPLTLELLQSLDFPLAAPSANPFGYVSPTSANHVNEQLGSKIEYILDGGPCNVGIESTIVSFEHDHDQPLVLRLGGCKIEEIEKIVGKVNVQLHSTSDPMAPGMLDSHYAPLTPILIGDIDRLIEEHSDKNIGILSYSKTYGNVDSTHQYALSEKADLEEAATRLFTGLRSLDSLNLQLILSEYVPDEGLGRAINDRLTRAEAKRN
jgi:L-threonylcarbamoyladenylate synthase